MSSIHADKARPAAASRTANYYRTFKRFHILESQCATLLNPDTANCHHDVSRAYLRPHTMLLCRDADSVRSSWPAVVHDTRLLRCTLSPGEGTCYSTWILRTNHDFRQDIVRSICYRYRINRLGSVAKMTSSSELLCNCYKLMKDRTGAEDKKRLRG